MTTALETTEGVMGSSVKEMTLVVVEASEEVIEVGAEAEAGVMMISSVEEDEEVVVDMMIEAEEEAEIGGGMTEDTRETETDTMMTIQPSEAPVEDGEAGVAGEMMERGQTRDTWIRVITRTLVTT